MSIFGKIPDNLTKSIIKKIPNELCAIEDIQPLPNGYILVKHIVGYKKLRLDIFGSDGKYLYIIKLSANLNLKKIKFYNGVLAGIEEREETNVYHEFKIISLPKVFCN